MAQVDISVDTSKKEVTVKVDGKKISNVRDICIYAGDYFGLDMGIYEDAGEDLIKRTRLLAENSENFLGQDQRLSYAEKSEHEGFVKVNDMTENIVKALFPNKMV